MPGPPADDFGTFMGRLAKLVLKKLAEHAHVNIVLVIADGRIQRVRQEESYLPANLPP